MEVREGEGESVAQVKMVTSRAVIGNEGKGELESSEDAERSRVGGSRRRENEGRSERHGRGEKGRVVCVFVCF